MAAAVKKIVVSGGNGFLGSRICKCAVLRGWDVTSISRSGEPKWDAVTDSAQPPPWARHVAWERADIFRPETYAPLYRGANYAVHSLGILLEADYKGLLSGRDSPLEGLRKVVAGGPSASSAASSSPLQSYERMNRDSALLAAKAAAAAGVEAFAYISAAGGAPVLPSRYISTKREAERLLTDAAVVKPSSSPSSAPSAPSASTSSSPPPLHRPIFIRAPFLYDAGARPVSVPLAALVGAGAIFNRATGGVLSEFLGAAGTRPMKADEVAEAVVEALTDPGVEGAVEVPQMTELAARAWRKGML